jgi:hypothetical protein
MGLGKVRMTVPGHPRTSGTLVRTNLSSLKHLSHSEGTDDRPGHPRTSETLVRTPCFLQNLFLLINYKVSVASIL